MKVRIARKKIKNDVLLQLWYKHLRDWYDLHIEHSSRGDSNSYFVSMWLYENAMKHFVKIAYQKYGITKKILNKTRLCFFLK